MEIAPDAVYNGRLTRSIPAIALLAAALVQAQTPPRAAARPEQGQNQLDASETLFTVLAALNASGFDYDLDSNANSPVRKQIRELLGARHLDSLEDLKKFFAAHRQQDPGAELSQYISLR